PAGEVALPARGLRAAPGARHRIPRPAAGTGGSAPCRAGAMTTHSETLARPRSGSITAMLIVAIPVVLALICVLARFEIIELAQSVRAALLFALLLALMATGMPIPIAPCF